MLWLTTLTAMLPIACTSMTRLLTDMPVCKREQ